MVVFPNAKINIGLQVVSKRDDGYHDIQSVFYPFYELFDALEIVENNEFKFKVTGLTVPGDLTDNLIVRAYELLKHEYDLPNVYIHLHKKIPMGAGLGGGSSDASFTLKALNQLFSLNISDLKLEEHALRLGSDCPFFIKNRAVYAFGKGNKFENVSVDLSEYEIKIAYPDVHISTAEAYDRIKPKLTKYNCKDLVLAPIEQWKSTIVNDFEAHLLKKYPAILSLKQKMYQEGALYASMTGSGSAVYGIFNK